ncbi:MAG: hypothetical protein ACO1RA_02690 [Planctomycetaceae bacterium]
MAYKCPRCGDKVERTASTVGAATFGLVGALIASAFGPLKCKQCGTVSKSEFPPDVQSQMTRGTIGLIATAVLVLVVALVAIAYINGAGR